MNYRVADVDAKLAALDDMSPTEMPALSGSDDLPSKCFFFLIFTTETRKV